MHLDHHDIVAGRESTQQDLRLRFTLAGAPGRASRPARRESTTVLTVATGIVVARSGVGDGTLFLGEVVHEDTAVVGPLDEVAALAGTRAARGREIAAED